MPQLPLDIALIIAIITGATEIVKYMIPEKYFKKYKKLSVFIALLLGLIYSFAYTYYKEPQNFDIFNTLLWGLGIGFSSSGGYENIKNLLLLLPKKVPVK
jgi:hypothetical protein